MLWGHEALKRRREDWPSYTDEEFYEQGHQFRTANLHIGLPSDIWFPYVWGHLEDIDRILRHADGNPRRDAHFNEVKQPRWEHVGQWYDNRELALQHTPRFNRFLQRVRQLGLDYGGTWAMDLSLIHI